MPANEAIRRIRHIFSAEGADKVVAAHERVAQSQREIAAASSSTEKATLSLDRQFANIERRYNATIRAQQDYERVQRQVNTAVAQNPELQQRANSVLALAEQRYRALAAANDNFTAAQRRGVAASQASVAAYERIGRSLSLIKGLLLGQLIGSAIGGAVDILTGKKFVEATAEQDKVLAQLQARLASTGHAAGLSAEELTKLASELQRTTTYGDEAVISAEALLLSFTRIGRDIFPDATRAVLDMATAMDQDLRSTVIQVGKALNDPIKGIDALRRVGVAFTELQKETIKTLVETGRAADAQRLILKELQAEFGGSAVAARDTLGGALQGLKNAFGDLFEVENAGVLKQAIEDLTSALQSDAFSGFAQRVRTSIVEALATAITYVRRFASALEALYNFDFTKIGSLAGRPQHEQDLILGVGSKMTAETDVSSFYNLPKPRPHRQAPVDFGLGSDTISKARAGEDTARRLAEQRRTALEKVQQESEALLRYGDNSKAAALAQAELAKYREKNLKVTPDLEGEIRGWAEQVARVQEFNEALKKVKSELTDMAVTFVQGLAHGEKAADLLNKAITRLSDKLLEMATRKLVEQALGSLLGGIGGAGSAGGGLIASIFASAHTGGVVGELSSSRVAHTSVFAGAHRYHTGGLAGDEVPVIARRGEGQVLRRSRGYPEPSAQAWHSNDHAYGTCE